MSLVEPTIWDTIKPYKRWLIYAGLGIVLLGLVFFLWDRGSSYFFDRKIDKMKANVNAALGQANQVAAPCFLLDDPANHALHSVRLFRQSLSESDGSCNIRRRSQAKRTPY